MAISDSLRSAIEALHQAIADEPQPEDKAALTQCLQQMLKVQAKNIAEGDYGPQQQQGPQGNPPGRRTALMQQLAGGQL
jgi:hypothetical protein